MKARNVPLARYQDRAGRSHLIVMRGRLVLDVGGAGAPRLLAQLSEEEGAAQARALLRGEGGYLERARKAEKPLCRGVSIEDVRPPARGEPADHGPVDAGSEGIAA